MQSNRRKIIDILKRCSAATVEELSQELGITSVTVRHHLDVLRSEGLVGEPVVRHRTQSGRPQHVYSLAGKAAEYFPRNYDGLAGALLDEMRSRLDPDQVSRIFEGAARRIVDEAPAPLPGDTIGQRAERAVEFLSAKGYVASAEKHPEGLVLKTCNCPYDALTEQNPELCNLDLQLVSVLMDTPVQRVCHMADGGSTCAYLVKADPTSLPSASASMNS